MLGCLETLITGAEVLARILVILFVPLFIGGMFLAVTGGTVFEPLPGHGGDVSAGEYWCCVGGFVIFFSGLLVVAIRRLF